jgi:hypothetical protein
MIGRGNRSTRRNPAPVPLCPPQTPHAVRTRTRAVAVGSQRVRLWAACGVCGGQSGTGSGFLRVLRFPMPDHSTNFSIIIITRGWHIRPLVAAVSSGPWFHPPLYKFKEILTAWASLIWRFEVSEAQQVGLEAKWNTETMLVGFTQVDWGFPEVWRRTEEQGKETKTSEALETGQWSPNSRQCRDMAVGWQTGKLKPGSRQAVNFSSVIS